MIDPFSHLFTERILMEHLRIGLSEALLCLLAHGSNYLLDHSRGCSVDTSHSIGP